MLTADERAALAARLRGQANAMRAMSDHLVRVYGDPPGTAHHDLLAAAAELERPRPLVTWEPSRETDPRPCWRAVVDGHAVGAAWLDPWGEWAVTRLDYGKAVVADLASGLDALRAHLIAAGFDVDEVLP